MMGKDEIILREININDIEILRELRNKERVRASFMDSRIIEYSAQLKWYEKYIQDDNDIIFAICKKMDGMIIGFVSIYNIDNMRKNAEFGRFMIADEFLGKGYANDVIKRIIDYSAKILRLTNLYLVVKKKNIIAYNCYKKAGFLVYKQDSNFMYMKKMLY